MLNIHSIASCILATSLMSSCSQQQVLEWKEKSQAITVDQDQSEVTTDFHFVNRSNQSTKVTSIVSSCNCTSASSDKMFYSPGEGGLVRVIMKTAGIVGQQHASLQVNTDQQSTNLTFLVAVEQQYSVVPRFVRWRQDEIPRPKQIVVNSVKTGEMKCIGIDVRDKSFLWTSKQSPG